MKFRFVFLLACLMLSAAAGVSAQSREMTFILLRHAEKDVSPSANKADPVLTAEGKQRAARLAEILKPYKTDQIFSTAFIRTRETATPLAKSLHPDFRIQIQNYDYNELEEFAARLLKLNAKTVVVVGHNTTTPALANLLIKKDKYKDLGDFEYDKLWIIKLKNGKVREEKIITY